MSLHENISSIRLPQRTVSLHQPQNIRHFFYVQVLFAEGSQNDGGPPQKRIDE